MKAERGKEASEEKFEAIRSWFIRFKERGCLHKTEKCKVKQLAKISNEGGYTKQILNVDETASYCKKTPSRTFIAREKSVSRFKEKVDFLFKD